MANLTPINEFSNVVQLEITDIVRGGENGKSNEQAQQLTNRTEFLNNKLDNFISQKNEKDNNQDTEILGLDTNLNLVKNEVTTARGTSANLNARLNSIDSTNSTQTTNISNLTTEVTNARSGSANLKTRIDNVATSVTNLSNGQVTTNKNNIATHTTQISTANTNISNINTQISNANSVVSKSTLKDTITELVNRINGKQASGSYVTTSQIATSIVNDTGKVARADTVYQVNTNATNAKTASNTNMPIGSIIMRACNTVPAGWLECNGQAISRTTYSALYNVIGVVYGTTATTNFQVPNLTGRFPEGNTSISSSNAYASAGLPNITGRVSTFNEVTTDGAFSNIGGDYGNPKSGGGATTYYIRQANFDASRSSAVYGKSSTVQPNACRVKFLIKFRSE